MSEAGTVPRIDLRELSERGEGPERRAAGVALLAALRETGFVRVVGHGIDPASIDRVHRLFARFFALPPDEKRRVGGVAGGQRGHTPFGVEHARDARFPDQKEFFHVGQVPAPGSALHDVYPANVWPESIPELRDAAMALYRDLEKTAGTLLEAIAESCSLPRETFASMIVEGNSILRAAHYPPVAHATFAAGAPPVAHATFAAGAPPVAGAPSCGDDGVSGFAVRAAAHEDINLITLLCGATDSGLELRTRSGRWIGIPARPDEIVADVGDMLARITNGWLPSTTHRVIARGESARRHRYALPFFAHPRPECDLRVLPAFVTRETPARFPPITAQAFLDERLREIGLVS